MTSFESNKYIVKASSTNISDYISKPENLVDILPADRIEGWKSDGDSCSFKIKGLASIKLKLGSVSTEKVVYVSEDGPFDFNLVVVINERESGSEVSASFDAEVASMMAMMLKSPLTNFLNSLGEALESKFS